MAGQAERGYDLFISYAGADRAWVEGYLLPALGLPPERLVTPGSFSPGAAVVAEFERAVAGSRYTLLVLTPAYLADQWAVFGEQLISHISLTEGRDRLIPLLLRPCTLPLRVDFRVRLDCTDEANWEGEIARLRALLGRPAPEPEHVACPYPGMVPFRAEDARFFYGRETEIRRLLRLLRQQRYFFVIGPSGSGKSSLIFAGLVPHLGEQQPGEWLVRSMRPGPDPMSSLAEALDRPDRFLKPVRSYSLTRNPPARRLLLVVDQFEELFTQADKSAQADFFAALKSLQGGEACTLLLAMRADFYPDLMNSDLWPVDVAQRLEVAPLRGEALRQAIQQPAADVGVYLEAGLLERLLADAADEPGALPLVQETMVLLWDDMQRRLLPLSAYERLGGPERSGLAVAIAEKADTILSQLSPEGQAIARRIFLRLVQFGEGRADTRRQQPVSALRAAGDDPALFDQTLRHLTANRLLTLGGEERRADRHVDLAHEALIGGWPRLQGWLAERREAEQTRRRLEAKAEEWQHLGQGEGGLLDEFELLEAENWLSSPDARELGGSSQTLDALVGKSRETIAAAEREREAARQRELEQAKALAIEAEARLRAEEQRAQETEARRRAEEARALEAEAREREQTRAARVLRRLVVALAGVLLIAVSAAVYAGMQQKRAEVERDRAEGQAHLANSRRLALQALTRLDSQVDLALLLSVVAHQTSDTVESRSSLLSGLERYPFLTTLLHGHETMLDSMAFSPDGRTLASGSIDGAIIVWDMASGQLLRQIRPEGDFAVSGVDISADGRTVVLHGCQELDTSGAWDRCTKGGVRWWDLVSSEPVEKPLIESTAVWSVALSRDGQTMAFASDGGLITLWDVQNGQPLGEPLANHSENVSSLAFSPDGKILASGSHDKTIVLWDVATRQPLGNPLVGHQDSVRSLAFGPDGKILASGSDDASLIVWDVTSGQPLREALTGHPYAVESLAFNPGGWLLASGGCGKRERDSEFGRCNQGVIYLWSTLAGNSFEPFESPLAGHNASVSALTFGPDGRSLASGDANGSVLVWDLPSPERPLGERLIGHDDWNRSAIAFSSDGHDLVSAGAYESILLWDSSSRQRTGEFLHGLDRVTSVALSLDSQRIALAGCIEGTMSSGCPQGQIHVWNLATDRLDDLAFTGHADWVRNVALSPDGKLLASGSDDGTVIVWDVASRRPLTTIDASTTSIVFSPDGQILALGGKGAIILWDVARSQPLGEPLMGHSDWVESIAFSPDGETLASGSVDKAVILWDVAAGQPLGAPLIGHNASVRSLAFSPDGKILASGSDTGTIILWDVATGQSLGQFTIGDFFTVWSLAFSPDGQTLASGTPLFVILWDLKPESWQHHACLMANRNLTQAEWDQFIGPDIPYQRTCPSLPPGKGVPPDAPAVAN